MIFFSLSLSQKKKEKSQNAKNVSVVPVKHVFFFLRRNINRDFFSGSKGVSVMSGGGKTNELLRIKYTAKLLFHQSPTWHSHYTVTGQ